MEIQRRYNNLPRYQRRTKEIDNAIATLYLAGTNTRWIKRPLRPMFKNVPLSRTGFGNHRRIYGEFRRRIKTQGKLPNEDTVLFATGQIRLLEMVKVIKGLDRAA